MKFGRTSTKTAEPVVATTSSEFPTFFSSSSKDVEPTEPAVTDSKNGRLFLRKKREGNSFDMMKTVNGDDDGPSDKSPRNIFRRKSKEEKSVTTKDASQSSSIPAIFAFPSKDAEDEGREGSSSRSLFRKKSKDNDSVVGSDNARDVAEPATVSDSAVSTKSSSKLFSKTERTQIKAVIHSFSPDADVIKVEKDDVPPALLATNHVLIKVQVCNCDELTG
jgi:hypothetical protein